MEKKTFFFDFTTSPKNLPDIVKAFNEKQYDNLDRLLKDIDWDGVSDELILPKNLKNFTRCIVDDEIRLDVMKFLKKYAKQYFREAAERLEYSENVRVASTVSLVQENVKSYDEYLDIFQEELESLIDQLENSGEFTGEKFNRQQKTIQELEKQVKELKAKNSELETELDRFRHPYDYGKHIPEPLWSEMFFDIMSYLTSKRIVKVIPMQTAWGEQPCCYYWCGSKVLFCYFVTQLNIALNLKKGRDNYDWQVFEPAIQNYDNLIKEARKAYSVCKNNKAGIKDAKKIDEAIQYALKKETDASAVRIYPTKNTNTNRV